MALITSDCGLMHGMERGQVRFVCQNCAGDSSRFEQVAKRQRTIQIHDTKDAKKVKAKRAKKGDKGEEGEKGEEVDTERMEERGGGGGGGKAVRPAPAARHLLMLSTDLVALNTDGDAEVLLMLKKAGTQNATAAVNTAAKIGLGLGAAVAVGGPAAAAAAKKQEKAAAKAGLGRLCELPTDLPILPGGLPVGLLARPEQAAARQRHSSQRAGVPWLFEPGGDHGCFDPAVTRLF